MKHLYFPVDCTVSLLCLTEDGVAAEIAVVGYEGVVGVALFLGGGIEYWAWAPTAPKWYFDMKGHVGVDS